MIDRKTILRHIETSVDVDEWAIIGVKENFNKLEKIEQIVNAGEYIENSKTYSYCYDNDTLIKHIREVLEQE